MRRGVVIGVTLLVIAAGIGIAVGAYHAGVNHGLDQAGQASEVVRVVDHGYGYGFPFGILLFPLVIFGIFAIAGAFRRRRWAAMGPGGGYGHWGPWGGGPGGVEELHRKLHEQESGERSGAGGGGPPATA